MLQRETVLEKSHHLFFLGSEDDANVWVSLPTSLSNISMKNQTKSRTSTNIHPDQIIWKKVFYAIFVRWPQENQPIIFF